MKERVIIGVVLLVLLCSTLVFAAELLPLSNRRASGDEISYAPGDGETIGVNPAAFRWLEERRVEVASYTLSYSQDPSFGEEVVVEGLTFPMYIPNQAMQPGVWHWRYRYQDPQGQLSEWSHVRTFTISEEAVIFPLPTAEEIASRMPGHPRLFVTPETLEDYRSIRYEMMQGIVFDRMYWDARGAQYAPLVPEPLPFPGGQWEVGHWRAMLDQTHKATEPMEQAAFVYMITGEEDLGETARRLILNVASWDPAGPTSARVNDECSMNILFRLARAYTWAYDALTPEDREVVQAAMAKRGDEAYQVLLRYPYHNSPFDSHAGRQLGLLGEAAIAFYGDIPQASEWLDYVLQIFFAVYPAWGGEAGGWAEGPIYWRFYMERALWFVDALQVATGINLYDKPFFRETGFFKLYVHPPYTQHSPFGDNLDEPANAEDHRVMSRLARALDEGVFEWYAQQIRGVMPSGPLGYLQTSPGPDVVSPSTLPAARAFFDVGWAAFHKDLADGRNNVHVLFKSSPYGSYSHSHADQNSFTLEAYGRPLLISSGYYPYYGSPHHTQWTRQTRSKNTILVGGRGQTDRSLVANGELEAFLHTPRIDYVRGEAGRAYAGQLRSFQRHLFFFRDGWVVIYDNIVGRRPQQYQWLLHSLDEFHYNAEAQIWSVGSSRAGLDFSLLYPSELSYSKTNEFPVRPEDRHANRPNHWHFTAATTEPQDSMEFLAVLLPYPGGGAAPRFEKWGEMGVEIWDGEKRHIATFASDWQEGEWAGDGWTALSFEGSELVSLVTAGTRVRFDEREWTWQGAEGLWSLWWDEAGLHLELPGQGLLKGVGPAPVLADASVTLEAIDGGWQIKK